MADTNLTEDQKKALEHFGKKVEDSSGAGKTQAEIDAEAKAEQERIAAEDAAKVEEERLKAEAEKKNIPEKKELTDEELMVLFEQKTGRKVNSWDEFKPTPSEDEKRIAAEKRDADKLSFGLKKGLFNKQQYEGFISDSKNPVELVYNRDLAAEKAADPEWNEEKEKEFRSEFEENFGLNLDPTSSKYKRGKNQLSLIADSILKKEYAAIYNLDNAYSQYENGLHQKSEQQNKILVAAPIYKNDVESIVDGLKSITVPLGKDSVEVSLPEEIKQAVKEVMLDDNFAASQILAGKNKENLSEFAIQYIRGQHFNQLVELAVIADRMKHEKGVRGIPEGGRASKPAASDEGLTEDQKKALQFFQGNKVTQPAAN